MEKNVLLRIKEASLKIPRGSCTISQVQFWTFSGFFIYFILCVQQGCPWKHGEHGVKPRSIKVATFSFQDHYAPGCQLMMNPRELLERTSIRG